MSMRRIVLAGLTLIVIVLSVGPALLSSLEQQQISGRLELYQTDLMLQAQELATEEGSATQLRQAIMGKSPLDGAIEQYRSVRQEMTQHLEDVDGASRGQASGETDDAPLDSVEPTAPSVAPAAPPQATLDAVDQQQFLNRIDLRLGILYAEADNLDMARDRWQTVASAGQAAPATDGQAQTAAVLSGLWRDPPQLLPDAEAQIQRSLQGWFQTRALNQLYSLQQRGDAVNTLAAAEQELAQQSVIKLGLLGIGPAFGGVIGVGLLIFLGVQRIFQGKTSLLAETNQRSWTTPWTWEITWQVLIVGFFFIGQIVLPLILVFARFLIINPLIDSSAAAAAAGGRISAVSTLVAYLLLALSSIGVLYLSIRTYRPLPEDWFKLKITSRWPLWGLGGYFAAVPLVIGVSVINQQLWQGRGGSNPLLQIVLNETDPVALGLFFFTAAVAAPIFEECLFRGFLLPSLTRYMAVWPAITLSAFIFAAAHLSVSEILPLMVLGIVLGFVYTRSRSLLAPMLVHSLWNSATMMGLLILGSVE